ncbi:MAG TPA: hypothetical protein VI251_10170 [Pseudolabrys sp.]
MSAAALAVALSGCSGGSNFDVSKINLNPKEAFTTPDWARPAQNNSGDLAPQGAVAPQDLVSADGACAPDAAQAQAAAAPPPANAPVGTPAGDLGGAQAPAGGDPNAQQALGGIALGMTECQAVRRAGQPSNVAISASSSGERRVVLTYQTGAWPGIYTFDSGRLKTVERIPGQEKPKAAVKKKPVKRAKAAAVHPAQPAAQPAADPAFVQ